MVRSLTKPPLPAADRRQIVAPPGHLVGVRIARPPKRRQPTPTDQSRQVSLEEMMCNQKWLWIVGWLAVPAAHAADPLALWNITNGKCVPHMRESNDPAPCSIVDLAAGYVVLKDLIGASQFLLIPTIRISGIESPELLVPGGPNYWDSAWRARALTEQRIGKALPRETLSLAVNSQYARTQNQLHIHIDCVQADVRDALAANQDTIGEAWTAFPVRLAGQSWRAYRVNGQNPGNVNPFRLLASSPDTAAEMGKHTLVMVGMTWRDNVAGFAVLDSVVDMVAGKRRSGEDLQDHDCTLAR